MDAIKTMTDKQLARFVRCCDALRDLIEIGALEYDQVINRLERLAEPDEDEMEEEAFDRLATQPQFDPASHEELMVSKGSVTVAATKVPFAARDHFVSSIRLFKAYFTSADAIVNISFVGKDFNECYRDVVEEPFDGSTVYYSDLIVPSCADGHIIATLGGEEKTEVTLTEVFAILAQQPDGESDSGPLLAQKECTNIFYVRNKLGALSAIHIFWLGRGWRIDANPVLGEELRYKGFRVFSGNPQPSRLHVA
jgi:hypothetical protein